MTLDTLESMADSQEERDKQIACRTVLLHDSPASDDAFGGHRRIASAIRELVQTETGGRAIALTGPWGSGKSTVVRILSEGFEQEEVEQTRCVVFDAWAHKGDYLRRSFLQHLIDELVLHGWLDQDEWTTEKEKLSGKAQKRFSRQRTLLTPIGRIVTILGLMLPLGISLVTSAGQQPGWFFWLGIALCSMLPISLPIAWLFSRWFPKLLEVPTSSDEEADSFLSKFSIFVRGGEETLTHETYESPSPTPLEFQEIFLRLLSGALSNEDRRLIIVIDNLDRVARDAARETWTTMQTFFEFGQLSRTVGFGRFWLVVPFDSGLPASLWNPESRAAEEGQADSVQPEDLAEHFLAKTFQIQFSVPQPLLSQWKDYMIKALQDALPEHTQAEFRSIFQLYDHLRSPADHTPTPREIKGFANNLGAIHRVWQDEIPLPIQAFYVLMRRTLRASTFVEVVTTGVDPRTRTLLGERRWVELLAAVHHGVEIKKALEAALGETIRRMLVDSDTKGLQDLSIEIDGFPSVLERMTRSEAWIWAVDSPEIALRAASAIDVIGDSHEKRNALLSIRRALLEQSSLVISDCRGCWAGMKSLLAVMPSENLVDDINRLFSKLAMPEDPTYAAGGSTTIKGWAELILQAGEHFQTIDVLDDVLSQARLPRDPEVVVSLLDELGERSARPEILEAMVPRQGIERFGEVFAASYLADTIKDSAVPIVWAGFQIAYKLQEETEAMDSDEQLERAVVQMIDVLAAVIEDGEEPVDDIAIRLEILLKLNCAHESYAETILQGLVAQGHVSEHLSRALESGWSEAVGIGILLMLLIEPAGEISDEWLSGLGIFNLEGNSAKESPHADAPRIDKDFLVPLVEYLRRYRLLPSILRSTAAHEKCDGIMRSILFEAVGSGDLAQQVSATVIVELHQSLIRVLGGDCPGLLRIYMSDEGLINALTNAQLSWEILDLLVAALEVVNGKERAQYTNLIQRVLAGVHEEDWLQEFTRNSQLTTSVSAFADGPRFVALANPLAGALLRYSKRLIANPMGEAPVWDLKVFIDLLAPPNADEVLEALLNLLIKNADQTTSRFLGAFGAALLSRQLDKRQSDRLLRAVLPEFVARKDPVELRWLRDLCRNDIVESITKRTYTELRPIARRSRDEAHGETPVVRYALESIARRFWRREKPRKSRRRTDI